MSSNPIVIALNRDTVLRWLGTICDPVGNIRCARRREVFYHKPRELWCPVGGGETDRYHSRISRLGLASHVALFWDV